MKKDYSTAASKSGEDIKKEKFDREDPTRRHGQGTPVNADQDKSKRKRITRIEKNPRENTRPEEGRSNSTERRSFNPNFTRDNKLREGNRSSKDGDQRKPYAPKDGDQRKPYAPKDGRSNARPADRFAKGRGNQPVKGRNLAKKPQDGDGYQGGEYPKFPAPEFDAPIRLNRLLAMSGLSSRREADTLILSGRVTVNGVVVTELGVKVLPTDIVKYDDKQVKGQNMIYIVMNKPKGFVTTIDDPHADKTVMDLVKNLVSERVYPVGRLDKNSIGVLLITNDGDMTKHLTHPAYDKKKIYHVSLDRPLSRADMQQIADGIELEDGKIHADEISYVGENKREVGIEIHSGRNRIVRRIFEHLDYKVTKLDRVYFAGLTKKLLKRGAWRFLTPKEVQILQSGMYE